MSSQTADARWGSRALLRVSMTATLALAVACGSASQPEPPASPDQPRAQKPASNAPAPHATPAEATATSRVTRPPSVKGRLVGRVKSGRRAAPSRVAFVDSFCPSFDETCIGGNLGVMGADGSGARLLTVEGRAPAFSPDGTQLAFDRPSSACPQGCGDLYIADIENGTSVIIAEGGRAASWAPDGQRIAYERKLNACVGGSTCSDIRTVGPGGSGDRLLVRDARSPAWSPDGRRVAFVRANDTRVTCRSEVWVADADGSDARRLTSAGVQVLSVAWAPDGKSLALARHDTTTCARGDKSEYGLYVMHSDGTSIRAVAKAADRVAWADARHLLFERVNCTPAFCPPPDVTIVGIDGQGSRLLRASTAWPAFTLALEVDG